MMTGKHTFELEYEQVDKIVCAELKESYSAFLPENRPSCGMYHSDREEDLKEMKKMRKAFKRVLDWYGEKVD
jgi:hypothetical protein